MGKYRKYLEFGALVILAAVILWWFGRRLDWAQVRLAVRDSDWRLILLASVIVLLGYLWRAFRWQSFLKPITPVKLREVWVATCVGFAAVLTIGRFGEVVRPVVLPMRDPRVRPAASFVTIMIERIYDMMTVGLVFAINLLWLKPVTASGSDFSLARKIGMVLVGVLFVTLALLFWFERSAPTVLEWLESRIPARSSLMARLKRGVLSTLEQLATALKVLSDVRLLAVSIFWSLMLWGFVAFGNLLVFRAFGVPFGMTEVLFVLGWSMIGSVVPTPGGAAGAFHAATGTAMVLLGVDGNHAAAIAIILHLVDFAPAALFGLYYFLRGDINLSRLRALLRVKAVESAIEDQPATASGAAR